MEKRSERTPEQVEKTRVRSIMVMLASMSFMVGGVLGMEMSSAKEKAPRLNADDGVGSHEAERLIVDTHGKVRHICFPVNYPTPNPKQNDNKQGSDDRGDDAGRMWAGSREGTSI